MFKTTNKKKQTTIITIVYVCFPKIFFSYQSTQINGTVLSSRQTFHIPKRNEKNDWRRRRKKRRGMWLQNGFPRNSARLTKPKQCQTKNVIHFGWLCRRSLSLFRFTENSYRDFGVWIRPQLASTRRRWQQFVKKSKEKKTPFWKHKPNEQEKNVNINNKPN